MDTIKLKNVRLSFPAVFKRQMYNGVEGKYAATLLISKDDKAQCKMIADAIAKVQKEANVEVPKDRWCLKDGDKTPYGWNGCYAIKATSDERVPVLNRDKSALTADDAVIYSGCMVNAAIDFWVQNNQYGKRVNANLYGIQFYADNEPFGAARPDVDEMFDNEGEFEPTGEEVGDIL